MGRDEHRSKKNARLSQTPEQQLKQSDGRDIEFSEELADAEDRQAAARSRAARNRNKK
jgi:hypothetical protein